MIVNEQHIITSWNGQIPFYYKGDIQHGTVIIIPGIDIDYHITTEMYESMAQKFSGRTVKIGDFSEDPGKGSVEHWFQEKYGGLGLMNFIGAILIEQGGATRKKNSLVFPDIH